MASGTWALEAWTDWSPLQRVIERCNNRSDLAWGKTPVVLETGYSTWNSAIANEADQVKWINTSIPALHDVVAASMALPHPVTLLNYYELIDMDSGGHASWLPPENDWGIVRSGDSMVKKPGFAALQQQIAAFNQT